MLDITKLKYIDKEGTTQEAGSITPTNLTSVLTGGNGITVASNTTGDKVEVGISRSEFQLGTPGTDGNGITFTYSSEAGETIYLGTGIKGNIEIYNAVNNTTNFIRVKDERGQHIEVNNSDILYRDVSNYPFYYLRENNVKTIGGQSIYGSGNIEVATNAYTSNVWSLQTTVIPISKLVPSTYNNYELEIFADANAKFKVEIDGHDVYSNGTYLKLIQTGGPMNALFATETGNIIHTNNLGGQLKDRVSIGGAVDGSMIVYFCKQL